MASEGRRVALCAVVVLSAICGWQFANAAPLNVHIVAHTHDDVGWLKTVDEYLYGANQSIQDAGVQYILDTVITALEQDPAKKFIYVEQAFFTRWWNEQTDAKKQSVIRLVNTSQLEFINGGWCMNDEASVHYTAVIDQMTEGHDFIFNTFGARPRIGWHIDPFGHSSTTAALMAKMGFDAFFFARMDYEDQHIRMLNKGLELVWRPFQSYGESEDMFTHMILDGYGTPGGFCFECGDDPIQTDPRLFNVNVKERADQFVQYAKYKAQYYRSNNILVPFGSDFQFSNANLNFKNMDKLIAYIQANQATYGVNMFYSTPSIYADAVNAEGDSFPLKTDDFFPYADGPHAYWTGYFTSRQALKQFVRSRTNILHAVDQLFSTIPTRSAVPFNTAIEQIQTLSQALGVAQHHDAVSGTEKQHVADDYALRLQIGTDAANTLASSLISQYIGGDLTFTDCPYANVSVCPPTQSVASGASIAVVIYNPVGQTNPSHVFRYPVSTASIDVTDENGATVPSQVYNNSDGQLTVAFAATNLPPLGFVVYTISATAAGKTPSAVFVEARPAKAGQDTVIGNSIQVTISGTTGRISSVYQNSTGVQVDLDQNYLWYNASNFGDAQDGQTSGAYIFRPNSSSLYNISNEYPSVQVLQGPIVSEVWQTFGSWLKQVVRVDNNAQEVQLEATIGPIPIDDNLGKEVVSVYTTGFKTESFFYTDTSGLEMLQRKIDYRPTWALNITEPVSENYYPINTAAYIQDTTGNARLTVVTDRTHGGASTTPGELEVMMQRRLLYDDGRGVGEPLNESAPIRAFDYLFVNTIASSSRQQRRLAQIQNFGPVVWFASIPQGFSPKATKFAPSAEFPENIRLETFKTRPDASYLVRMAHLFGVNEDAVLSQNVTVDIASLFTGRTISSVEELTLSANRPLSELHRLVWNVDGEAAKKPVNPTSSFDNISAYSITISPMDIRTFNITFSS